MQDASPGNDPLVESISSRIVQFRKNLALKTRYNKEFLSCKSLQASLANKASLNIAKSLNPIPPSLFGLHIVSHFTQ